MWCVGANKLQISYLGLLVLTQIHSTIFCVKNLFKIPVFLNYHPYSSCGGTDDWKNMSRSKVRYERTWLPQLGLWNQPVTCEDGMWFTHGFVTKKNPPIFSPPFCALCLFPDRVLFDFMELSPLGHHVLQTPMVLRSYWERMRTTNHKAGKCYLKRMW